MISSQKYEFGLYFYVSMSDISEPQDLEKAHISDWFTLANHFEEHVVPDVV